MSKYFVYKSLIELRKIWAVIKKDRYDRIANELLDVLMRKWDENTRLVIGEVIRQIKGEQIFSRTELDIIIEALKIRLGDAFANEVAQPLYETHLSTYIEGVKDVLDVTPTLQQVDHNAIAALQNHNIYWVHSFFDRQLANRVTQLGQTIIEEGLSRSKAGKLFESALSNELQQFSWRYWEGFANHVVTRSRELGHVDGYIQADVEYIQIKAVLDYRTTPICREMHNRIFEIAKVIELKNKLVNAKNPEDVKKIAPWLKPEQVKGKKTSSLPNGMALPPYHFNCRTRTVKYIRKNSYEIDKTVFGSKISKERKKDLKGLSKEEWGSWIADIKKRKKLPYNEKDLNSDVKIHGPIFNTDDPKIYAELARKAIKKAGQATVHIYKGRKQFYFYSDEGIALVDESMQIRGLFGPRGENFLKAFNGMREKRLWLKLKDNE